MESLDFETITFKSLGTVGMLHNGRNMYENCRRKGLHHSPGGCKVDTVRTSRSRSNAVVRMLPQRAGPPNRLKVENYFRFIMKQCREKIVFGGQQHSGQLSLTPVKLTSVDARILKKINGDLQL